MAVYKVPQDVEAEDKLLGPFTFRQFIYLLIAAGLGLLIWFLITMGGFFIFISVIFIPICLFFVVLAAPLKKEQPMEVYFMAMVQFHFIKPRKRLWQPDGVESLITIVAPKEEDEDLTKHLTQQEAKERLGLLTDIVDSRGWAVRGTGVPTHGVSSVNQEYVDEADAAGDMFDGTGAESQKFDKLIEERQAQHLQSIQNRMSQTQPIIDQNSYPQPFDKMSYQVPPTNQTPGQPNYSTAASPSAPTPSPAPASNPAQPNFSAPSRGQPTPSPVVFQPATAQTQPSYNQSAYSQPTSLSPSFQPANQNFGPNQPSNNNVQPDQNQFNVQKASVIEPSPDIIKLANESDDLTVADIARQAQRISEREQKLTGDEVTISLH